jgi:rhodanese-related sulfurtransferase
MRAATTEQVQELIEKGAQLVEVLPQTAYDTEHLPGALNLPLPSMTRQAAAQLDPDRPVVVYCYDTECDLSSRGAALLTAYGFPDVWDYTGSKVEWVSRGLPAEGTVAHSDRAGGRCHAVPTCAPDATVGGLDFDELTDLCVVLDGDGVVLGALRREVLGAPEGTRVLEVLQPGPTSVRPSITAQELAKSMSDKGETSVLVTTLDGRLLGVVTLSELGA